MGGENNEKCQSSSSTFLASSFGETDESGISHNFVCNFRVHTCNEMCLPWVRKPCCKMSERKMSL